MAEKVRKIVKWPACRNVTEAKAFIGICVYYRTWIKDFSLVAEPIFRLFRPSRDFEGTTGKEEKKERGGICLGSRVRESVEEAEDCPLFSTRAEAVGLHAGGRRFRGGNHSWRRRVSVRFCSNFAAGGSAQQAPPIEI